jgi:hypothetical protein
VPGNINKASVAGQDLCAASTFLYPRGTVYIFENAEAERVKVGMTGIGANSVMDRLRDVNDMWLERKVTCQICGGRLVNVGGCVPGHVAIGKSCLGGAAPPLERDLTLAESYLEKLRNYSIALRGTEKGSMVRRVRTLEARIARYRQYARPAGVWEFRAAFHTEGVAELESLSHKLLEKCLDQLAPFGEVFCCSAAEAVEAVETALGRLGLGRSATRQRALVGSVPFRSW